MRRVTDVSSWVATHSVQHVDPIHSEKPAKPLQSVNIGGGDAGVKPDTWSLDCSHESGQVLVSRWSQANARSSDDIGR
jgi:hypothetical protein